MRPTLILMEGATSVGIMAAMGVGITAAIAGDISEKHRSAKMMGPIRIDHCVVHISDWDKSNAFYRDVLGAEVVANNAGYVYRFGMQQLNLHGPGLDPKPVARWPVLPGGSDLCFEWPGSLAEAQAHLARQGVEIEMGPVERFGARGPGLSIYFRDPDGSLLEFIIY